jgi:hypothetical protein
MIASPFLTAGSGLKTARKRIGTSMTRMLPSSNVVGTGSFLGPVHRHCLSAKGIMIRFERIAESLLCIRKKKEDCQTSSSEA